MSRITSAFLGFLFGAAVFGFGWYVDDRHAVLRRLPAQIPFDSTGWKEGDSFARGRMYRDLVKVLQELRPTDKRAEVLLGPPGVTDKDYLNAAEVYLVYQIDLGQYMGGMPFLYKLGLAFHKDGSFSHVATWD